MNNNSKSKKEKSNKKNNLESSLNSTPKIQNINTNNIINQHSKIAIQKKEEYNYLPNNINKPDEIKAFDALSHFKQNIIHSEKNCQDPISELSYYCFSCKHSVCNKCGLNNHKEHILIQRNNCLNYDKSFFNEISQLIEDSFGIEERKNDIKNKISNSINDLKKNLDSMKNNKFREIDNLFVKLKNNLLELKNNYLKTKKIIEDYYSANHDFFNLYIEKNNNSIDINKCFYKDMNISYNENLNNNENNDINESQLLIKNKDIENTIFILNFDLMNICDNQNIKILNFIKNIKNKINIYLDEIDKKTPLIQNNILHYLDIPLDIDIIDDFYKGINSRAVKYSEIIEQFKETISEIIKKTSNYDKIKDLINILDSKNNKGKEQIFEQDFFKSPYIKKNNDNLKIRKNSKNKKLKRGISGDFKIIERNSNKQSIKINNDNNNISLNNLKINLLKRNTSKNSKNKKNSVSPFNTLGNNSKNLRNNKKMQKSISFFGPWEKNNYKPLNKIEIILNQRILQKFFAYTIYSFYSKYYGISKNKEKAKKIDRKNNNYSASNKYLFELKNPNNENEEIVETVSYLANYTQRYNKLKEQVKPIIGTNQIQLYDLITKKITKKTVYLAKEEHGYSLFPEGCRHILLNNNLYITGGTDMYGVAINIVLLYNIQNNNISKINNLIDNHSYHTLEYLENYDCIILIGGENSSNCEIMDVDLKKWYKLPSLNYPRANINIYYNFITNDLFALFGINGDISEKKNKYSDIIEVIEMNNISNGWSKVDYYKGSGLNLKSNYCMTLPFTKDKLLIYGADNIRSANNNLFSIFDFNKNECIKVDINTLEQIKLEEKKIRLFDLALNKMKFDN